MSSAGVALLLVALLAAPHLLRQERLAATSGVALWASSLFLRAAISILLALIAILFLPATDLFNLLTHWCLHAVVPFFANHLGFNGHRLGDAAVIVPALVIAASSLSVGFGLWRGARAVRRLLRRSSIGPGPASSIIVADSDIVVAAAGIRAPKVIVSAGALLHLDDAELEAGLQHEWGHVRRYHRYISAIAEICGALARPVPGTRYAVSTLRMHLERDADDYAVRQTGDSLALASAICKVAQGKPKPGNPAVASLGGSGVAARLQRLIGNPDSTNAHLHAVLAGSLTTSMVMVTLGLLAAAPTLGSVGAEQAQRGGMDRAMNCA